MGNRPRSELHQQLRQATAALHEALDRHPILAPLIQPGLSVSQYGNVLAALHGVFQSAEEWVKACLSNNPLPFDYGLRRKVPALESDLAALGREAIPARTALNILPRTSTLIGILYTLEGSTQGGQFIARHLQKSGVDWPMQFFGGYGDRSGQLWEAFWLFADYQCPPDEYELAAGAAASLFESIRQHLDHAQAIFAAK